MGDQKPETEQSFGGQWTEHKLNILEHYLDAYTTALRNQPFSLWYIDAFAGTGRIELPSDEHGDDIQRFISGSAKRAIHIRNKPFDKLIFVEATNKVRELERLKNQHPGREIVIVKCDANTYLSELGNQWSDRRGVLFIDPFGAQFSWETLKKVASYRALDTWLLFPVNAVSRMLPKTGQLNQIDDQWAKQLTTIYGNESWKALYRSQRQDDMFNPDLVERAPGVEGLCQIYKDNLKNLFGHRYLEHSCTLKNSKNSPLYELLFCAGHPNGAPIAKKVAKHIVEHL